MSKNNIIEIKKLKKSYHTKNEEILAIDDFSYNFKDGEFVSIVGPSGCGKSTILSILTNLEKKSSGIIKFKDNIKVGYMLQQDCLFEWKTILENCTLGLEINSNNCLLKEEIINLLVKYGLQDFLDIYPPQLSGGMRQRVALIRTLATNPDVLLLDEPFSALDYQSRLSVSKDVYEIIKNEKKTAIMVTHDIAEAISMSDKVLVLSKRPCKIKKIIDINLSNSTNPIENRKAKEFSLYYDYIWKELDCYE